MIEQVHGYLCQEPLIESSLLIDELTSCVLNTVKRTFRLHKHRVGIASDSIVWIALHKSPKPTCHLVCRREGRIGIGGSLTGLDGHDIAASLGNFGNGCILRGD